MPVRIWFRNLLAFGGCMIIATAIVSTPAALAVEEDVDLLLVLAADVSRSIDDNKFKLQRDGYAAAISDPLIVKAMQTAGPKRRIGLIFIEWAGVGETKIIVDWTSIGSEAEAKKFADAIVEAPRPFYGRTSIAGAIDTGMEALRGAPYRSERQVIDISGDGTNNSGREVTTARDAAIERGITINGIVILSAVPLPFNPAHTHPPGGLLAYYQNNVVGGPASFAIAADSFETFGQALRSKRGNRGGSSSSWSIRSIFHAADSSGAQVQPAQRRWAAFAFRKRGRASTTRSTRAPNSRRTSSRDRAATF